MKNCFYENGLKFSCQRCSFCCGGSPGFVYLSKRDLLALCEYTKLSVKDFVEKYTRWADYYGGTTVLALKEKKNFDCILWDNGCTAYPSRPVQCSTYPFWTWMIEDEREWNDCSKECPGINKGDLHSKQEIEEKSEAYSNNIPLLREEVIKMM